MIKTKIYNSEKGIALVAALFMCMLLLALGTIIVTLSTGDISASAQLVGEKKAMSAAEKGITRLVINFNPYNPSASAQETETEDTDVDSNSLYQIEGATLPDIGPEYIPMSGESIAGGQIFGRVRYNSNVRGINTTYNTSVRIGVGLGYGPVDISTMSR